MTGFNAVLFDVDGTLIHSAPGILDTLEYTFRQMGVDPTGFDLMRYVGPPLRRSFAEHFSNSDDVERAVEIYRVRYREKGQHMCTLYPGVLTMLQTLQDGGVTLCTATSKPVPVVTPILEELKIAEFFDIIGGASVDKSRDTKTAVVKYVQSQLPDKQLLLVGDRRDDMQGAKDCGIPAAWVSYGYGSDAEVDSFAPCVKVKDCESLTKFILHRKNSLDKE